MVLAALSCAAPVVTDAEDTEAVTAFGAASLADRELGAVGVAELHAVSAMLTITGAMNGRNRSVTRIAMLLLLWSAVSLSHLRGANSAASSSPRAWSAPTAGRARPSHRKSAPRRQSHRRGR